jgi:tripartite ATP-independent transporter DctP family solute receptor
LMASRLAELTRGDLRIQLKHSAQLGNEDLAWKNVRNGSLDIARINFATLASDVPAARLLSLPYLFRSRDHLWRVLGGDFGKRINAEIEKTGAIVLAYYDSGTRSFYTSRKQIRFRSDFEGQRIRVQNSPVYKDLITLLGGTPVVVPYEKVIDAFRNGEIDGAENNTMSYVSSEHYKYARYYSLDEHSSVPEVLLMAKKTWDGLPPEQQKAVMAAAAESSEHMKRLWAEAEALALAKARKEGVVILEKHQLGMGGIETYAVKLYSKYVTNPQDLETVLNILRSN